MYKTLTGIGLALLTLVVPVSTRSSLADQSVEEPVMSTGSMAAFGERMIDLSVSWEGAQACAITDDGNACFATEAEMDAFLRERTTSSRAAPFASCSTALRLYDQPSYGTPALSISSRSLYINLASYSFSKVTSSFKVGACSAALYDSSSTLYPGSTTAGTQASSMVSGWNNRVAAIYLY